MVDGDPGNGADAARVVLGERCRVCDRDYRLAGERE